MALSILLRRLGVSLKKNKRGFKTKGEVEQWERDFLQQQQKKLDINFEKSIQQTKQFKRKKMKNCKVVGTIKMWGMAVTIPIYLLKMKRGSDIIKPIVGIHSAEELTEIGSKQAVFRLKEKYGYLCCYALSFESCYSWD